MSMCKKMSTWTLSSDIFEKPAEIPYAEAVPCGRLYIHVQIINVKANEIKIESCPTAEIKCVHMKYTK